MVEHVDEITIERARRGERDAQSALLRTLADVWFRFCVSQTGDVERARDATQETALRFLNQLHGFRGQSKIETWSLGIAVNVLREQRRDAGRRDVSRLTIGIQPREFAEMEDRPGRDELEKLRSVLHELPDRQREAIVLRFFEELSVEETAAAMNCAAGTVKATVHQAIRAMRARLENVK